MMTSPVKEIWLIRIAGYGTFEFEGTEAAAESMRIHKAQWEGGTGMKWRRNQQTPADKLRAKIAATFDAGNGVPGAWLRQLAKLEGR